MLVIREEQMEAFERSQYEAFGWQVVGELSRALPRVMAAFSRRETEALLETALDKARRYRVRKRRDVRTFIYLSFVIGPHFDAYHLFRDWITRETLSMSRRLDLIVHRASVEDWERAALCGGAD
jgi:hypothetical protein